MLTDYSVVVGSINMDLRSFYQQFESSIYTNDYKIMESVECDFEKTFGESQLLDVNNKLNFFGRLSAGVLRILSPLM